MVEHPRIQSPTGPRLLSGTAAELGYRMPAEFEPMRRIWLTRSHNAETWPGCLDRARAQFDAWVEAMKPFVESRTTQSLGIATDDSWIRDYGPVFVVKRERGNPAGGGETEIACHDFYFNSWGERYGPWDLDNVVPQLIAREMNVPVWVHDFVLEGGAIEVNGHGTVMTTESCLLEEHRNPHLSRGQIERKLNDSLGTHHVIWLPGGDVGGDDTSGHVDNLARFVNKDTVIAVHPGKDHPDHEVLDRNWMSLQSARDQDGRKLTLVELPAPEPVFYDFPADQWSDGGRRRIPSSFGNFLIANGGVFVPVFGQRGDDIACRVIEQAMPGYKVIPVRAEWLVVGLGALHCLSQQEPA